MEKQVVVIGAGIIGICTALSLAERGVSVILLDRNEPGSGASSGNAGVISPFSVVPQSMPGLWKNIPRWLIDPKGPVNIRPGHFPKFIPWALKFLRNGTIQKVHKTAEAMHNLNHDNIHLYRKYLQGTGFESLIKDSFYVYAYRSHEKANLTTIENKIRRQYGAKVDLIQSTDLRMLEPALSAEFKSAIVVNGQARALSPGKICAVLARKFIEAGGRIERQTVLSLARSADGWQIKTKTKTFLAKRVVLAAGAWSIDLLRPLGLSMPLEAERGYHVLYKNPGVELNNSVMDMDMKFVASSMDLGLRAAGTAEYAGLDHPPNPRRLYALKENAKRLCPDMNTDDLQTWTGVRPSFPDSLPVIGAITGFEGLIGAFGHSHWGFMMGPKTGQIVADIVTDRTPNIDLAPYSSERFSSKSWITQNV